MIKTRTVEMQTQLVGYEFKKKGLPTDKNIAIENSKVSNDYFWKTNEYTDKDVFGRTLDLTSLINKPDGYLKGSLSDAEDVDYYRFNITEYRALSFVKDTYNKDITITLDHIPEGCDYEMVLYDEEGNQVGIGKDNGNGGLSITIPNWNTDNRGYTVKVQAKDGSVVNPDAEYHLSFQTTQADKSHRAYQEMAEIQKYARTVRKQMQEGLTDTEEMRAIKKIRQKYKAYYAEQMEKLHRKQAEDVIQGGAVPDDEQIHDLLEKKAAGKELTEQENALLNIFCTAAELDSANASAKMNITVKDRIFADLQEAGIDISNSMFSIKIRADGQVSVDGINDSAMKRKIEDVLSKHSDELLDIYFSMDSEIQALSDKEKYLLKAAVDVEKFLYKATGGSVSLGNLSVENATIHGLPKTLDDLLNNSGGNLTYQDYASDIREILEYKRTQHKDIMSELNVQFIMSEGTIQIMRGGFMEIAISSATSFANTKNSISLQSGEPDWSMIPSAKKSNKTQAEFVDEIKKLARKAANTTSKAELENIHRQRTSLCAEYMSDVSPNRKALYQQAKNAVKSSNHNQKCQGIGELSLLDFLERAEGNKSNLAEKKFVLAGGGTLVCPILTSGGYGADIYYQGTKALTYLGSGYGWACERTPAEREKEKEFYGIYFNEYHTIKNDQQSELEKLPDYLKENPSFDMKA